MTLDISKAIAPKSDQINADSLLSGPMTIKIRDVKVDPAGEQPISVFYEGDEGKPWKPCKTAARCLAAIWGANAEQWFGMSCTIYCDPTVTWGGAAVGGIRVSHMEGLDKPRQLSLTKTRGKKGIVTIQPLILQDAPKIDVEAAQAAARDAAAKGNDAFLAWWKDNVPLRDAVKPIMDEIKATVSAADAPKDEQPPTDQTEDEELPM